MASLAELLRKKREDDVATARIGAKTIDSGVASTLGSTAGKVDAQFASHTINRLKKMLNQGELSPEDLSAGDKTLIGSKWLKNYINVPKPGEGDSSFLGVGGPLGEMAGNFANEAVALGKGIPGGLIATGAALGGDVVERVTDPLGSQSTSGLPLGKRTMSELVEPTVQAYKEKYTTGSIGDIARRAIIEEPLGTTLDVGTLATGGAGVVAKTGSGLAKLGTGLEAASEGTGTLGKIGAGLRTAGDYGKTFGYYGTRGTRPDLPIGRGIAFPREYGVSPIVRAAQRATDKYTSRLPGVGDRLSDWRKTAAIRKMVRSQSGRERLNSAHNAALASRPVIEVMKPLSDKEVTALTLLKNGINDQAARPRGGMERGNISMVDSFLEHLDASYAGEAAPGYNIREMVDVDPEYNRGLKVAVEDPEVRALISNPTEPMIHASDVWDEAVVTNLESHGITAEAHEQRKWAPQEALRTSPEKLKDVENAAEIEAIRDPAGAHARFAEKHIAENGEEFPIAPNYIPHELAQGTYADNIMDIDRPKPDERVQLAEAHVRKRPGYLRDTELRTLLSGAMRVDTGPLVRHIANRERMLAHNGLLDDFGARFGAKDANGETIRVKTDEEMALKGLSPKDYVALDLDGAVAFHKEEISFLKDMVNTVKEAMREAPKDLSSREGEITKSINQYIEDAGQKASVSVMSASSPLKTVVPREAAVYFEKTLASMVPESMRVFKQYDKFMNGWRAALLAASPRWWINTFIGSMVLTGLSGAARPKYAGAALRHGKGELTAKLVRRYGDQSKIGRWAQDHLGSAERAAKLQEAAPEFGVGGLFGGELGETELSYTHRRFNPVRRAFKTVDSVEQFFKRMGIFHQLDKQAKAQMRQLDEVLDNYKSIGKMDDQYSDELLSNHPDLVNAAVDDANKFYYNYTLLGPGERRWVRRVVPFWGWYKFVTRLMYQLPFQYPGRTNVLSKLSDISNEFSEEELGILPPTIKGAIFLNKDRSNLEYIPTFGLNPFSDFANPAAPEGTLAGLVNAQQLSPVLGAFLTSQGHDPYSGGSLELSPGSGLLEAGYGKVIDPETGEEVPGGLGSAMSGTRFLGALARSIPQIATLETILNGGRYPYADSIPLINQKPVPVEAGEAYGEGGDMSLLGLTLSPAEQYAIRSSFGPILPKTINLRDYQAGLAQDIQSGETKRDSQLKALRKAGVR